MTQLHLMPPSSLRAMPTPRVEANSVPSSSAVTPDTNTPCSARCFSVQPRSIFASSAMPSTVPTAIVSDAVLARWILVPPFDNRIIVLPGLYNRTMILPGFAPRSIRATVPPPHQHTQKAPWPASPISRKRITPSSPNSSARSAPGGAAALINVYKLLLHSPPLAASWLDIVSTARFKTDARRPPARDRHHPRRSPQSHHLRVQAARAAAVGARRA